MYREAKNSRGTKKEKQNWKIEQNFKAQSEDCYFPIQLSIK